MSSISGIKQVSEDFITLLQRSEAALEQVARRLETEFSERFDACGGQVNPLALVKRIHKLQQDLPALKAECQALIQCKQGLIDAAKLQLVDNRSKLEGLCSRAGMAVPDDGGVLASFHAAVGEWDAQAVVHSAELGVSQHVMSTGELNRALAGSMLSA